MEVSLVVLRPVRALHYMLLVLLHFVRTLPKVALVMIGFEIRALVLLICYLYYIQSTPLFLYTNLYNSWLSVDGKSSHADCGIDCIDGEFPRIAKFFFSFAAAEPRQEPIPFSRPLSLPTHFRFHYCHFLTFTLPPGSLSSHHRVPTATRSDSSTHHVSRARRHHSAGPTS